MLGVSGPTTASAAKQHSYPQHSAGGRRFTAHPLEKATKIVPHIAVDGLYFDALFSQYQRYVGIRRNEVDRSHNLRWIISTNKLMPFLSPCEVIAFPPGAHAHGTTITVVGTPRSPGDLDDIVPQGILSPDDFIADIIDNIVVLLPPSSTFWGERSSYAPSPAVGSSVSS